MRNYFQLSRTHTYSLLFALPLLVLYELGAALIASGTAGLRNGADVLLRTLLAAGGVQGTLAFTAVLAVGAGVLILLEQRRRRVRVRAPVFAAMFAESAVYALLFGVVVGTLTRWVLGGGVGLAAGGGALQRLPTADGIVLSLGAGIYEELVFRVLLTGGLATLFGVLGASRSTAGSAAAILAALLFSAFHYVGPYAYPLELSSFTFRFLAGLAFSVLFLLRGFGIAAWTHALYDVFLVLVGTG